MTCEVFCLEMGMKLIFFENDEDFSSLSCVRHLDNSASCDRSSLGMKCVSTGHDNRTPLDIGICTSSVLSTLTGVLKIVHSSKLWES